MVSLQALLYLLKAEVVLLKSSVTCRDIPPGMRERTKAKEILLYIYIEREKGRNLHICITSLAFCVCVFV